MIQEFLNAPLAWQILMGLVAAAAFVIVVGAAIITIKNEIRK